MNLLHDDINEVTSAVIRTLMHNKINHCVHVAKDGTVATRRADVIRNALSIDTLIGTYNHHVTHEELKVDLLAELQDLSLARRAT